MVWESPVNGCDESDGKNSMTKILGIDIGGSGMKAAPVDVAAGKLLSDRYRIPTPRPAKPDAMADVVAELVKEFKWSGPVGCAFPGVTCDNTIFTAANLHKSWVNKNAGELFTEACGNPVTMINDADAAGLAEVKFGAAKGVKGVVIMVTIGTGIGTAMFTNGVLVPNTELGHLDMNGTEAEDLASARVKEDDDLSWKKYSKRLDRYLDELERLLWPDLFIIGGGMSTDFDRFDSRLSLRAKIVPASLHNNAGIVGAALAAI